MKRKSWLVSLPRGRNSFRVMCAICLLFVSATFGGNVFADTGETVTEIELAPEVSEATEEELLVGSDEEHPEENEEESSEDGVEGEDTEHYAGSDETTEGDDEDTEEVIAYPSLIEVENATQLAVYAQEGLLIPQLDEGGLPIGATFGHDFLFVDGNGVQAFLPDGLEVETAEKTPFDVMALGIDHIELEKLSANDIDIDDVFGSTKFGIPGQSLYFSQPVQLRIPISGIQDGEVVFIRVRHGGSDSYTISGLTNNPDATCSDGVSSDDSNGAVVENGFVTIYTCGASDFVVLNGVAVGDAMLRTNLVEIGINQNGVFGADFTSLPTGFHDSRISNYFGFIANPLDDGWVDYDGDFFTPGTREEGFCMEIGGTNYCNNKHTELTNIPGGIESVATGTFVGRAGVQLIRTGSAGGLDVRRSYTIHQDQIYILMRTTLTNNSAGTLSGIYWMHNVDPDNNQSINSDYGTTNTILSQPLSGMNQTLVTAYHAPGGGTDADGSTVALFADDPNARVTYGGFANRSASAVWYGTGLTSLSGSTQTADKAISLAISIGELGTGESITFNYAYNLASDVDEIVTVINAINTSTCGDSTIAISESCDDGNTTNGDGCSSVCEIESGYECTGEPSVCSLVGTPPVEETSGGGKKSSGGGGGGGKFIVPKNMDTTFKGPYEVKGESDEGESNETDSSDDSEKDDTDTPPVQEEKDEQKEDIGEPEELTVENLFTQMMLLDVSDCNEEEYIEGRYQKLIDQQDFIVHMVPQDYLDILGNEVIARIRSMSTLVGLLQNEQLRHQNIHETVCRIEKLKSMQDLKYQHTGYESNKDLALYVLQYIQDLLILKW